MYLINSINTEAITPRSGMSPHFGIATGQGFAFDAARTLTVCVLLVLVVVWSRRFEKKSMTTHIQDAEHDVEIWSRRCKKCLGTADEHEQSHEMMIDDDEIDRQIDRSIDR